MEYVITKDNGTGVGKKTSNCACIDFNLDRGEVFTMFGDQRGSVVKIMRGAVWVTQENDMDDYKLYQGEEFEIFRSGKVILQGVPTARVRITPAEDNLSEPMEMVETTQVRK